MFWSRNSCICEIRKVYCSSTLSDKYFSRNTLRFVLPNLERQRLPHHDLLVSIAIWRSEVKKLNLLKHLSRILLKVRGLVTQASSLDLSPLSVFAHPVTCCKPQDLTGLIENNEFDLCITLEDECWHWPFAIPRWLYLVINKELLDNVKESIENKEILVEVDDILFNFV